MMAVMSAAYAQSHSMGNTACHISTRQLSCGSSLQCLLIVQICKLQCEQHACCLTEGFVLLPILSCAVRCGLLDTQYGEYRCGFNGDSEDTRLVAFGIRYIMENYVMRPWTADDVNKAANFYR